MARARLRVTLSQPAHLPPAPSKQIDVVSKNTMSRPVNKSRRVQWVEGAPLRLDAVEEGAFCLVPVAEALHEGFIAVQEGA